MIEATFPSLEQEKALAERHGASEVLHLKTLDAVEEAAEGVDVLIVQFARVGAEAIGCRADGAARVHYGLGLDNIDLKAAKARGVPVNYVPDYATREIPVS